MKKRVVVAMSGGVDSSVTAALLKNEGYEVIGMTMQIWERSEDWGGCCGLENVEDAKRVANRLGIPHYVVNFRALFKEKVIANFCEEYREGRTPNPCIRCNQYIKFGALLKKAKELNTDYIATGHYARIEYDKNKKRYLLKKGVDYKKDQSYLLYTMTPKQLKHTLMPLGEFTKEKTRAIAEGLDLSVARKPESQEICFIPDDNYPKFLQEYLPEAARPGPILNRQGKAVGRHCGILFYTIGQRKRLGIAAKEPLYVIAIDKEKNVIVVGKKEEVYTKGLIATSINYVAIERPKGSLKVKAKVRYLHQPAEAVVTPLKRKRASVKFKEPQWALTPGQAIVFYDGDIIVGGGTIDQVDGNL
ncbi:MAG: tRNA 2-thiouridine(34) synthase MnmA [bacterium (Candidatus Ratteibacteria) CG_4_9_14_3_um_filter_41_21]|uniref:tRNA-specific 2-thiouridylase MnmA n=3 Tax=Candidatus Ratteibacteria TaxID=2979319 RepID=A0A2M7E8P3_9BACT|nr:MAG: tRNA 2-thiouridine(34) synthase MnmA [bacterium (Candidatus Ratteibacteria) CG01_land_8_20_14_3_00_40_19]PIW34104.1 MAG: tRNA 2-thiouridine(34) synthase MnmA [bacterium (Candidatus Ratteibacteria) CG15_BIG_FIL_POST_REV_8_21_14_020_41_12]PJA61873.1 MAG: tRNA 2-thiouridine(34) synthase MnmA [bacterium (Candidatus Ratteibacteria) CG_4_9_14_3_um_filter_41_21]HCG76429.1 tRNA 2-thiouridine(34) synthase MnmA [bacterium]